MKTNKPTPFKSYSKQAFTPEVPAKVLHQGHLVSIDKTEPLATPDTEDMTLFDHGD